MPMPSKIIKEVHSFRVFRCLGPATQDHCDRINAAFRRQGCPDTARLDKATGMAVLRSSTAFYTYMHDKEE